MTDMPHQLPSSGGSYLRLPDGTLQRLEEAPAEAVAQPAAPEPPLQPEPEAILADPVPEEVKPVVKTTTKKE